jgi:uncharacterized protein YcgI (DUF1989 family)
MSTIVPAGQGTYVKLAVGQRIKIINPSGDQVVETWAFPITGIPTWMSMPQSQRNLSKTHPSIGDTFIDAMKRPILTLMRDTSSGVHDMQNPPCDEAGQSGGDSCVGNLKKALYAAVHDGILDAGCPATRVHDVIADWGVTPEPLKLSMNGALGALHGHEEKDVLQVKKPECDENSYVVLAAEMDCLIVLSACSNVLLGKNDGQPGHAAFGVSD